MFAYRARNCLFGALMILMFAGGVLLGSSPALAQDTGGFSPPTIDKECTPDRIEVGETFTCTIDVLAARNTVATTRVTDTLPSSVRVISADSQFLINGNPVQEGDPVPDEAQFPPNDPLLPELPIEPDETIPPAPPCEVSGNTVTCPEPDFPRLVPIFNVFDVFSFGYRVNITAVAQEQCGAFTNTATASGERFGFLDDQTQTEVSRWTRTP
ncbi:MAG: hypothetical protein ACFB50_07445 [Rubrobacteraceae bacterium]